MKRLVFLLVILLTACGSTARHEPVLSHEQTPPGRDEAFARANEIVRSLGESLDYRAPFDTTKIDRYEGARQLYRRACRQDHQRACWLFAGMSDKHSTDLELIDWVRYWCLERSHVDCRNSVWFEATGRLEALSTEHDSGCARPTCSEDELRRECITGNGASCFYILRFEPKDSDQLRRRGVALADAECEVGVIRGCVLALWQDTSAPRERRVQQGLCRYSRSSCYFAGQSSTLWPDEMRTYFERACQVGHADSCIRLGELYDKKHFPEPVPRRGRALIEYGCRSGHADLQLRVCRAYFHAFDDDDFDDEEEP